MPTGAITYNPIKCLAQSPVRGGERTS